MRSNQRKPKRKEILKPTIGGTWTNTSKPTKPPSKRPRPNHSNTLADRSKQPGSQIQTPYHRSQFPFPFPRRESSEQNLLPRSSDQKQAETDSRRSPWIQRLEGAAEASSKVYTGSSCDVTPSTSPLSSLEPSSASGLLIMEFISCGSTIMLGNDMKIFQFWGQGNRKNEITDASL